MLWNLWDMRSTSKYLLHWFLILFKDFLLKKLWYCHITYYNYRIKLHIVYQSITDLLKIHLTIVKETEKKLPSFLKMCDSPCYYCIQETGNWGAYKLQFLPSQMSMVQVFIWRSFWKLESICVSVNIGSMDQFKKKI